VPHGYDVAILSIQYQPLKVGDKDVAAVGYNVGANEVGDTVPKAVGGTVGAAVGFVGQLVMPCLKAHKAFASILMLIGWIEADA
jgi:hypothetical protein